MRLKTQLIENTWLRRTTQMDFGWGNGYVLLPKGHPYYQVHYNKIPIYVHGGLTYSEQHGEFWKIGFDTAHWSDTLARWPKTRVAKETEKLRLLLNKIRVVRRKGGYRAVYVK